MLPRIRKAMDEREGGFTLIELLVVIIIIGILAAIAIPTFLNQKQKGYEAALKNDLKTFQVAEESYATDNNGAYVDAGAGGTATLPAAISDLEAQGLKLTQGVSIDKIVASAGAYCAEASHTSLSGVVYKIDQDGVPTKVVGGAGC